MRGGWFARQYADIRGNLKWGFLMFLWWLLTSYGKKILGLIPQIPHWLAHVILYVLSIAGFVWIAKRMTGSQPFKDESAINDAEDAPGADDTVYKELEQLQAFRPPFFLVCANGYPLQRTQSGIALNLQIVSSAATKLVYAKAMLTRREGYNGQTHHIELESSEPHIIPAMQTFLRMLEVKLDPEEAKRFMAPNVEIMGQLKLEENNTHQVVPFQLLTHRECPDDPNLPQLRAKLHEAETRLATLNKPPGDLHVELVCFQRGTTLDMAETTYFLKLNISCDEETGIKDVKIKLTIGNDTVEAKPMEDLSRWILRTPFNNKEYPYKSFNDQVMTAVSLWDNLRRDGLRSGLLKDGWLGVKIEKVISLTTLVPQLEIQITKSKQREPFSVAFTTLPKCEDLHIFDRAFKDASASF